MHIAGGRPWRTEACGRAPLLLPFSALAWCLWLPWLRLAALVALNSLRGVMSFLPGSRGGAPAAPDEASKAHEKLRGYHDLLQDILSRARVRHEAGNYNEAVKLYEMGLTVCDEGLGMDVPYAGIANSNVGTWRSNLSQWRESISSYLRKHESGNPGPSISPPHHQGTTRPVSARVSQNTRRAAATTPRPFSSNSLRRSAQPSDAGPSSGGSAAAAGKGGGGGSSSSEDERLRETVLSEVLDSRPSVAWEDIAGLERAKQALQELVILPALRKDLFTGIRSPARGLLLYGPPGNGKTMLAKALAREANATFFSLSASSLTSKWMGEGEKLVRVLFSVARERAPSVIFLDEIDSILSARSSGEHEASRRLKTEFLVQFDGMAGQEAHVVVIGATNRPQELDDAVRRRLEKRIYIHLPDNRGRASLLRHVLASGKTRVKLLEFEVDAIAKATEGFSGADLTALCREAAMQPLRELGHRVKDVSAAAIRPVDIQDFSDALVNVKPSVDTSQLDAFESWTRQFGTAG